tara:strand:+ start:176 stop:508 length:333 start_codon:yes stop_codon:yes gene_type:complete
MAASLKLTELNSVSSGSLGDSDILLVTDVGNDVSKKITKAAIAGSIKIEQFQDITADYTEESTKHPLFPAHLIYDQTTNVWRFLTDAEVILQAQMDGSILWVDNLNVGAT